MISTYMMFRGHRCRRFTDLDRTIGYTYRGSPLMSMAEMVEYFNRLEYMTCGRQRYSDRADRRSHKLADHQD